MTITVTRDGNTITATGSIDLTDVGLGTPTGTASGTITDPNLEFSFSSPGVSGSGTGTITVNEISGEGTIQTYGNFTYSGTIAGGVVTGTYDFPGGGAGEVTLQKQ